MHPLSVPCRMLLVPMLAIGGMVVANAQQAALAPPASAPGSQVVDTAAKPVGLKVLSSGNSWSNENSAPLCQAAGITGHTTVRRQGLNPHTLEGVQPGEVDVWMWQATSLDPQRQLPPVIAAGIGQNPHFRVIIQQPWLVHDGRPRDATSKPEDYEDTDLDEYKVTLDKQRAGLEAEIDKLNAAAGRRVVFMVPLADAMLEVRKMIKAGTFPGVTKQSDGNSVLRGDIMPHQGLLAMRLGAFMHFAALYKMSPDGLMFPGKDGDGLTEDQRTILQKMAWDRISKYPYAGIAKPPEPKPPETKSGPAQLNAPAAGG